MSGFICMHRDALNHPLLQDPARLGAWFWLVARAAWQPTPYDIKGKIIVLQRGQLCVSFRQLSEQWGWSKSAVERFFTRLKTETMIETDTGTCKNIITICNYSKYQDKNYEAGTVIGTVTGTTSGQHRDTNKQGNKETSTILESKASNIVSASAKPKAEKAVLTIFPDAFEPKHFAPSTRSHEIISGWPLGRIDTELERFSSHHRAHGKKMRDWQAAWATWVLNTEKFGRQANGARNSDNSNQFDSHNSMVQAIALRRAERASQQPEML